MSRVVRRLCDLCVVVLAVALALPGQAQATVSANHGFPDTAVGNGSSSPGQTVGNGKGQKIKHGSSTPSTISPLEKGGNQIQVSPPSLSFPDTTIPAASSAQVVGVTNHTGRAVTFASITTSPNFVVSQNQCGSSLAGKASCRIYVAFAPAASGPLTGTLTINEMSPDASQSVTLSGNGVSGGVPVSPASLSFLDTTIPAASSPQAVSLTNYTGQTLTFGAITASSNFAVSSNSCGSSLAAGRSCQIAVQFVPAASGPLTGTLTINETSPAGSQAVALSGRGVSGGVPVSPASLRFPDTTIPAASSSQVVTLANYTGEKLFFGAVTASPNFAVTANECGSSLAAGASCQIAVQFVPAASGPLTGTLTVNETSTGGSQSVALSGKGVSGGVPVSPASLSFLDTTIPAASSSQVVTLTNYTGEKLFFGAVTASPNFAVTANECGSSLAAGASCQIYVQFAPAASGDLSGTLTVNETSPVGTQTIALSGKGMSGGVPVSPVSLTFVDTTIPAASSSQVVNVTNYTGQPLTFGMITVSSNFAMTSNGCGSSLAAGASCQMYVQFAPTASGDLSGTLTINETSSAGTQTVALSGKGLSGGVPFSPALLSFPGTPIPTTSSAEAVTLTNYTGQTLTFGTITASPNFTVSSNGCGGSLSPGANCQIYVQFAPAAYGDVSGTLTVNETNPAGTQIIALSGKGLSGGVLVNPASLSFTDVTLPAAGSSQVVNLTNYTGQMVTFGDIAASSNFAVSQNQCGSSLAAGTSCQISVQFVPTASGDLSGTLTINETSPVGTQTIALSGKALSGGVQLSTASLNFPDTLKGSVSASQAVQIKNYTGQPLTVASATASGDFNVALNTCTGPVAEGGTCQISVQFSPTATGQRTGTLTIVDSDGTQYVNLVGICNAAGPPPVLQLHVSDSPARVNLDDPLVLDWIVWGADLNTSPTTAPTRKGGVTNQISDMVLSGEPAPGIDTTGYIKYSWSNATGVGPVNVTDLKPEVYTYTDGASFVFTVPTFDTVKTLNVYAGAGGLVTFEAGLSDSSAPAVSDVYQSTVEDDRVYSIDYRAGTAGQILTVKLTVTGAYPWLTLQAAALRQYAPRVVITSPADGQSFAAGADIPVLLEATTFDSSLKQLSLQVDGGIQAVSPSAPFTTTLAAVTPGHHVLTAQATDSSEAGVTGDAQPAQVDVIGDGGNLSVNVTTVDAPAVDLTSAGPADWVLWGYRYYDSSDPENPNKVIPIIRKAGLVAPLISDYTIIGNHPLVSTYFCGNDYRFSFSGGDIVRDAYGVSAQACVDGERNGFEITIPATTTPQRLSLYVGADNGKGKLTAFLSDGSAPAVVNQAIDPGPVNGGWSPADNTVYAVDFKAASEGQKLTVRFILDKAYGWGDINLHAATLQ